MNPPYHLKARLQMKGDSNTFGTANDEEESVAKQLLIKGGLASVTFRHLSPERIVSLVSEGGLSAIEWGGDVHVPHGDLETARDVGRRTRNAGLEVASYGSYYNAGQNEEAELTFTSVLETALALEAPLIRVWAGSRSPKDADAHYREMVAEDTRRISEQASEADIRIAYEYHSNSLTETPESAIARPYTGRCLSTLRPSNAWRAFRKSCRTSQMFTCFTGYP